MHVTPLIKLAKGTQNSSVYKLILESMYMYAT